MSHIFLLVGAPAVGKSTTAHALAARFQKSIHIPVDNIRDMVVSGLLLPGPEWSLGLIEQVALARASVIQMALNYSKAGFVVVIDDFWDTNSKLREYESLIQEANFHKILLLPSQQAAEERNIKRAGPGDGNPYIADGIRAVYEQLHNDFPNGERSGWMVVDTTDLNIESTVAQILTKIDKEK